MLKIVDNRNSSMCRAVCLALGLFVSVAMLHAQSIEEADDSYEQLCEIQADTTFTKDDFYKKALQCCQAYMVAITNTSRTTASYEHARTMLKNLYPFARAAAGYYSQADQDSVAMDYARTAVDIAMMEEMRDQGLRTMPDYPSFVYYVASHTYNNHQYEWAVKYLKEYVEVADEEKANSVLSFLQQAEVSLAQNRKDLGYKRDVLKDVPYFDVFAREYIKERIDKWKQKDPYETVAEYKERVNEATARAKQKELQDTLLQEYVQRFAYKMTIEDMELKPYDADNQAFLIYSPYGNIVLKVPRTNSEARDFANGWKKMKLRDMQFVIAHRKMALSALTFQTPSGQRYVYNNKQDLAYSETQIDANFASSLIDYDQLANSDANRQNPVINKQEVVVGISDVDVNIPDSRKTNDKTFAVIIANEHYTLVPQVPLAGKDGNVFASYCQKTLGLPRENILYYPDATYGKMIRALTDIKNIADAYKDIRVIFYYAGHGIPNEKTKDAFLLPIDADGKQTEVCYPLKKLYEQLAELETESVIVFLDACFSGATGDGKSLMASARGVEIETNDEEALGNMVIFSATTSGQTAYPYKERGHGLFTYFLLKKLQSSKGNATLGELGDYIVNNVKQRSVLINHKVQTPTITPAAAVADQWRKMKLK